MLKRARFKLELSDNIKVRSLEELQGIKDFLVEDIHNHYRSKQLQNWLDSQGCVEEANKIDNIKSEDVLKIITEIKGIFHLEIKKQI